MQSKNLFLLSIFCFIINASLFAQNLTEAYPGTQERKVSPGKTNYYIDPQAGNDNNVGINRRAPWKSFKRVNQLILSPGDRIEILKPGSFSESLVLIAHGNKSLPINIYFASGRYDVFPAHVIAKRLHISNTNDKPYQSKSIALMFDSCQFTNITGHANFVLRGKMMETYVNNCTNIKFDGLSFDYERPTVSELKVVAVGSNYSDLQMHRDSKFSIKDSLLTWEGEGWSSAPGSLWQILDLKSGMLRRIGINMDDIRYVQLGKDRVRAYYRDPNQNRRFEKGYVYQNRNIERDYAGIFMQRSKNIELKNMRIYFMHGMGIVSQYCENIKVNKLIVKPADSSGRTCAAWADILHFSGCKGMIDIGDSYLSAANDDAVNVHGTYLKIKQIKSATEILVEFMQEQTFGFNPYAKGDSIDLVQSKSLLAVESNVVTNSTMLNDKEVLLTLKDPISTRVNVNDAVENITATPEVSIHNNVITRIPTRGILTTTRRKISIKNNDFSYNYMSAILVSDDASDWYESGMVKDMLITQNNFSNCGEPTIAIYPENKEKAKIPVHKNIAVTKNIFNTDSSKILYAKSTSNLRMNNNKIKMSKSNKNVEELIDLKDCEQFEILNNKIVTQRK